MDRRANGQQTTYTYEPQRNLKTIIQNNFNSQVVSQYDYVYDEIGRRTSVVNSGTAFAQAAFSKYGYNDRSELTAADRYLGTDIEDLTNPVAAEQRGYQYDPIGNRTQAAEAATPITYTANELNQYTAVDSFTPTYDADGNMTVAPDGMVYSYNAENRLVIVQPQVPAEGDTRLEFVYDYMGRRVQKAVSTYAAGAWVPEKDIRFVYDGWNLIKETVTPEGQAAVDKYYVWGLDLSQSLQGAGGVGGLLAAEDGVLTYLYCYDANGNVGQVVDKSDGSISAHYEYDPFGNVVLESGSLDNTFRFSTKYFDIKTSLYYYGYRYYSPKIGRWINRDPIEEEGGNCLYSFVQNRPISNFDLFGLLRFILGPETEPHITFDEDFRYDPAANPTMEDYINLAKFQLLLHGAHSFAPGLSDAVRAYRHYLEGSGHDLNIDFEKAYIEDKNVKKDVREVMNKAQRQAERFSSTSHSGFSMTSDTDPSRYYPVTENWQKTIGQFNIWGSAVVEFCGKEFEMKIRVHEIDRYNFNRGASDIATGLPDDINGRFAELGWARSFLTRGVIERTIKWDKGDISGTTKYSFGKYFVR